MALAEELVPGAIVKGLLLAGSATLISVKWHGTACTVVYQDVSGNVDRTLLYPDAITALDIVSAGLPWSFDADGALYRLASEAYRIRLAYLFDPHIAVHTSLIEPLPHQITAVYETMLGKQPLRYLLADDPGAGKTIMREVVKHLTSLYGAKVKVTLEIEAEFPQAVPEGTVRTVEENCRTLRFEEE